MSSYHFDGSLGRLPPHFAEVLPVFSWDTSEIGGDPCISHSEAYHDTFFGSDLVSGTGNIVKLLVLYTVQLALALHTGSVNRELSYGHFQR